MKKAAAVLFLVIAIFAEPELVVLNSFGETISWASWGTELSNDIMITGSIPNQLIWAGEHDFFIVNSGNSTVQKCHMDGNTPITDDEYLMPEGSNPYLAYFDPTSRLLVVSLWVTGQLAVVDVETGGISVTDRMSFTSIQGVYTDGEFIYVTDANFNSVTFEYGTGMLYKLDIDATRIDSVEVGTNPQQIVMDNAGLIHVISTGDYMTVVGSAHIVDPDEMTTRAIIPLGGNPGRLVHDPVTNTMYSVTSVWGEFGSGRLLAYDPEAFEVLHSLVVDPIHLSGTGLTGLAVWNSTAFVPSMDSSWVEMVTVESGDVINVFDAGYGPMDAVLIGDMTCESVLEIPTVTSLGQAYPNPFNGACRIELPAERVEIRDVNGRKVAEIDSGVWRPGDSVPSGVYMARSVDRTDAPPLRLVYMK